MSLTLEIRLPQSIDAETRIQELNLLRDLFGDEYPKQNYTRISGMSKVSYNVKAQLEQFPSTPEQIAYIEHRDFTLTGTPKVACRVCGPVTGQLTPVAAQEPV